MTVRLGGNWGTTNLTVFPLDGEDVRHGPGIAKLHHSQMIETLRPLMQGETEIIMCGMVGSTIGLREAAYVPVPAGLDVLAEHIVWHEEAGLRIGIVPGVRCEGPDVMRGEETELMGWLQGGLKNGLVCIPGTHTKWVRMANGCISNFTTALTGELFALLEQHSVLLANPVTQLNEIAFGEGVAMARSKGASLLHQLFQTRARQLDGGLSPQAAPSFLSGLLIGHDIVGARCGDDPVHLIASDRLAELYNLAFAQFGIAASTMSSLNASRAGLNAIINRISG